MDLKETIDRLKYFALFEELKNDDEKMEKVVSILESRNIPKGEYIFHQGDDGDELFILMSGVVRVCKNTKNEDEYTIIDLKSDWNVFFGEIAIMDNDVRSASILVLEDCHVLVMKKNDFVELGNQHPSIGLPITRVIGKKICQNLRNVNNDVIMLFDALVDEIETSLL